MKLRKSLALIVFLLFAPACFGNSIQVKLASDTQSVEFPKFIIKDLGRANQNASYSHVRVYHLEEECEVPNCQLVWHIVVSEDRSPRKITYGALPAFGAVTVISAAKLVTGEKYFMAIGQEHKTPQSHSGYFTFSVNEKGILEPLLEAE